MVFPSRSVWIALAYWGQGVGPSKQPDLAGVNRLVQGAKEERAEFDRPGRVGHFGRFKENRCRGLTDEFHRCDVDPFEHSEHRLAVRMGAWVLHGVGASGVAFSEPAGHELDVTFGSTPLAKKHQAVLGNGQMTNLPSKIAWDARRRCLPKLVRDLLDQAQSVSSSEVHLAKGSIPHADDLGRGWQRW